MDLREDMEFLHDIVYTSDRLEVLHIGHTDDLLDPFPGHGYLPFSCFSDTEAVAFLEILQVIELHRGILSIPIFRYDGFSGIFGDEEILQLIDSLVPCGRDGEIFLSLEMFCKLLGDGDDFIRIHDIGFGKYDDFLFLSERFRKKFQLLSDVLIILHYRFFPLSHIKKVEEYMCPFDVFQKLYSEPLSFGSTRNKPRNILKDQVLSLMLHHPEIRDKGRERIVGDFRPYVRDTLDEGRFPGIRESDDPDIRNELQFELDTFLFPDIPKLRKSGSLTDT